uniref:Uncharacterized protein n=1 Tax=Salmonella phage vB_SE130_2P TaxID=3236707 RepID=A0AB39C508_9VIRU
MLNSSIGIICLVAIIITSLINIYAHWIEDGLFGRLLYMASVLPPPVCSPISLPVPSRHS